MVLEVQIQQKDCGKDCTWIWNLDEQVEDDTACMQGYFFGKSLHDRS